METFEKDKSMDDSSRQPESTVEPVAADQEMKAPCLPEQELTAEAAGDSCKEAEAQMCDDARSEGESPAAEPDIPHSPVPAGQQGEVFSAEACWAREAEAGESFWHSTTIPEPVYRAEREESDSPYADSPYVSYNEARQNGTAEQWRASFDDAPPVKKSKKTRKTRQSGKKVGKGLIAAALAFAVLGSAAGSVITGAVMNGAMERANAELQGQIDALKEQSGGIVINTATTPSGSGTAAVGGTMTPSQVYARNVQSVISVTATGYATNRWTTSQFTSTGSGFIISEDGYILTNYHVIEGYSEVKVTTKDEESYEAEVIGYDAFSDVALLKVEAEGLPSVIIGDSDAAVVGDMVAAIGNPLGELASTQTVGYISAKNRMVNTDGTILNMLQTDAAINSGNSGGPLFNMNGQVIGITTAKYSGSSSSGATIEGIGFAIPINAVMDLIEDLMEHGYVTNQAYMGINMDEMDPSVAKYYGLPTGPRVAIIEEGSAAEKAGLQVGDIIDALGDVDITTVADLSYAMRSYRAGDTATIKVYRGGEFLELPITFDEKPAQTTTTEPVETQPQQDYSGGFPFSWPFG